MRYGTKMNAVKEVTLQTIVWSLSKSLLVLEFISWFFFFQAEDGIRDVAVTGVQTCALPILQEAQRAKRPVLEVLAESCGLAGDRYARALAGAFDYRFVSSGELAQLEPDFSVLAPSDATRRHCVVVHEGERLLAVFADPFDQALRGWLELRVSAPLETALAAREELANLIARRAEALRAIDTVLPETDEGGKGEERVG